MRAPAAAASATCPPVASLCPTLIMTPAAASWPMAARAPPASGARVTSRSTPAPAEISSPTAAGDGGTIQLGLCAPLRAGEMNGPSTCTPSTRAAPPGIAGTNAAAERRAAARSATGAVM